MTTLAAKSSNVFELKKQWPEVGRKAFVLSQKNKYRTNGILHHRFPNTQELSS